MSEGTRTIRISPSTLYREVQGEAILLHLDSGEYFGLDGVATRIWQLMVEKGNLDAVERAMLEEFDVDSAVVSADLTRLVDELVAKGLIEVDGAPSSASSS
jgi:hypothetical protein